MTTLISHYGGGHAHRHCSARCHDARGPICRCICGGRFHGKGFAHAQQQLTDDVHAELLAEAGKQGRRLALAPAVQNYLGQRRVIASREGIIN